MVFFPLDLFLDKDEGGTNERKSFLKKKKKKRGGRSKISARRIRSWADCRQRLVFSSRRCDSARARPGGQLEEQRLLPFSQSLIHRPAGQNTSPPSPPATSSSTTQGSAPSSSLNLRPPYKIELNGVPRASNLVILTNAASTKAASAFTCPSYGKIGKTEGRRLLL